MTALRDNPNGEVQVKVRYFDKDARSWVSRQGNVTAHNNQLYFHGTDGASNDADEDPIEWPVPGAQYGEILTRVVNEGIQQATGIVRDGINAASALSENQQNLNQEMARNLHAQQTALSRAQEEHGATTRITAETMAKERARIEADRLANVGTTEQLAAREAKLKDMETKLETREKEFKFWMDERTDEMLEYARKTIEKDFQPPPTPLRAQTTSTETQMTPARRANSTTTSWTAPAVTPQRTRRQPPPPPPPPNRNITFDDPFDVDNDEEEEDDEEYDEEASMGGWSRPSAGSRTNSKTDVAVDAIAFDPKRWGGLTSVQQQSLTLYLSQRTKTTKAAQVYLVEDLLRVVKGLLQMAEVFPALVNQEGFQAAGTTVIKRLRMVTMLAEGQSATFVGFFGDEVSGAGQPEYLRLAERRAGKLAAAAATSQSKGRGGGGGSGKGKGGRGKGKGGSQS